MYLPGVAYATIARLNSDISILQNNLSVAFAQINELASGADAKLLEVKMQQVFRRLDRLETHSKKTGVAPLP